MLVLQAAMFLGRLADRLRRALSEEHGAEVPEYVIVVAIIAMLAVVGLVAVKAGLLSNLNGISACLSGTASGTASSCK